MLAFLAGCATPVPRPTQADVLRAAGSRPRTTLAELEHGRARYVSRCSNCHRPYPPSQYRPDAWHAQVDAMAERAKLGAEDRASIVLYLVTLSER